MKKIGFTLAEVIITLGIIGVVSTLTAPSLVSSYQKTKVGPTLRKFINTIENANQSILMESMVNDLSIAVGSDNAGIYLQSLQNHVKGRFVGAGITGIDSNAKTPTAYDGSSSVPTPSFVFQFQDGSSLSGTSNGEVIPPPQTTPPPSYPAPTATVQAFTFQASPAYKGPYTGNYFYYDINGFQNGPNKMGRDVFAFIIDKSGSVIPYGSKLAHDIYNTPYWNTTKTDAACSSSSVSGGLTCAGSVIDNNGDVIYKY